LRDEYLFSRFRTNLFNPAATSTRALKKLIQLIWQLSPTGKREKYSGMRRMRRLFPEKNYLE
jgi:hypothetical protein